ncbi:hypothetical protein EON64_21180, partial [archaeon]
MEFQRGLSAEQWSSWLRFARKEKKRQQQLTLTLAQTTEAPHMQPQHMQQDDPYDQSTLPTQELLHGPEELRERSQMGGASWDPIPTP